MQRIVLTGIIALLAAVAALAQAQNPRPAYDAASVKLNTSNSGHSSSNGSKGQIVFTNQTLKRLVERAYGVKPFQVTGPNWMEDAHFDISAKYPPDTKGDEHMLMLRTLLEDRFKLVAHRETKELLGYALVVAKGGFKLKPVEPGDSGTDSEGGRVRTLKAEKVSMAAVADFVARTMGEAVIDKTGLERVYDFELKWNNDDRNPNPGEEAVPSLATALQETLGLRLQPQKVPVEMIVVDRAERVPIEN